ncbi:hypothetical protein MRB53_042246 [Persea americana]|nr:hypothetical protein MRB53_042246 [Persea americana]
MGEVFKSPQVDMGYDISDYKDIDPCYGSLADVDRLIAELKKRDMKLMIDIVVNHTSNQVFDTYSRSVALLIPSASLVPRIEILAGQSQARLVHLEEAKGMASMENVNHQITGQ